MNSPANPRGEREERSAAGEERGASAATGNSASSVSTPTKSGNAKAMTGSAVVGPRER
jgi:hypothetical protein